MGVDYVTLTAKTPASIGKLKMYGDAQVALLEREGFHVKPSRPMGYDGWQVGPVFLGARFDGFMLRVSGQMAHEAARLWDEDIHCTRLDVQATLKHFPAWSPWGKISLGVAEAYQKANPRRGGYPHGRLEDGRGKGDTVKVGSRTSDRYGRLYDKEKESLDPVYDGCWRYEVEYKGDYALLACRTLRASQFSAREAGRMALAEYKAWGYPIPETELQMCEPLAVDSPKSDVERRKAWLRRQVGPTILSLLAQGEVAFVDSWVASLYNAVRE
jgi:hypothetical protein